MEIRRHLNAHPKLSGQEYQTAAYVAGGLSSCGLNVEEASREAMILRCSSVKDTMLLPY